jgi:uncharacterized LabA/DUF88 family protein
MGVYAVFVDAAYLERSGYRTLRITSQRLLLDPRAVVRWAHRLGRGRGSGERLLRTYWYDGAFEPTHRDYRGQRQYFDAVQDVPGVVLRLGYVVERTPAWQTPVRRALRSCGVALADFERHFRFQPERAQKGVDALLTLDLLHLAQRRAYDWAVVVAGDRDFEQVVLTAQGEGRRILVAVPTTKDLAPQLRRAADEVVVIDSHALAAFFAPSSAADAAQAS